MKKIGILSLLVSGMIAAKGQVQFMPGARLVNNGNVVLVLQDMNLVNNGLIVPGTGTFKFAGSNNSSISSLPGTVFNDLLVNKQGNTALSLASDIRVAGTVQFQSGLLELNQHELGLENTALLVNETPQSRITGVNGGVVSITMPMNGPVNNNPGNLGAVISSGANLGNVLVRRGHQQQSGTGMSGSIHRYYDIIPDNNVGLNATLRVNYFDPELNGQAEDALTLYRSADAGASWNNAVFSQRSSNANYVELSGVNSFSRWTLSSFATTLPVTGMEFSVQRKGEQQVQLQWKTLQEFSNKGFTIQRRKANETDFSTVRFVQTAAPGGNSYLPLLYSANDTNSYKGITYYRIQQEDIDGKKAYSPVRFITGSGDKTITMKVWPVPSSGELTILVSGVEKELLQLTDMQGRIVRQVQINGAVPVKINQLAPGNYLLYLPGRGKVYQQVIVQ